MKSQFILILIICLVTFSGCYSVKTNDNFAVIVAPIDLPVTPERDKNQFFPLYDYMSLYDFLKDNNFQVDTISNDPLIYRIPDQEGLLEELARILKTIRKMIDVCNMNLANANTTRTNENKTYRRKIWVINKKFEMEKLVDVPGDLKQLYDPDHPDADKDGYYYLPNVNEIEAKNQIMDLTRLHNDILKIIGKINKNCVI